MAETYHRFCSFEAHKNIARVEGTGFILLVFIEHVREKCEGKRRTPPLVPACTIWNLKTKKLPSKGKNYQEAKPTCC